MNPHIKLQLTSILFAVLFFIFGSINKTQAAVLFSDDFNRNDSDSLGQSWEEFYGTRPAYIRDGHAYVSTSAGGFWGLFKVASLDAQDQVVSVTFVHQNGDSTVLARVQGIDYRIVANYYKSEPLQIYEVYAGNYRVIPNSAPNAVIGETYTIKISTIGDNLKVWVNDILYADTTLTYITSGSAGFGANDGYTDVYFDNFLVSNEDAQHTPTPSPSATPTSTPQAIPTPTPALTSSPTTKVLLIPGLGSGWNFDALVTCKNNVPQSEWKMASYAENIYQDLVSELAKADWQTFTFNYDWTKDVRSNSKALSEYLDSVLQPNEKINIVGHSMGGLVAGQYLVENSGGNVAKLLMVGTPNKGSTYAYPIYANGQVWMDDLIQKIASTIYIKRCGIPTSIQNILPVYNYLREKRTNTLIDYSLVKSKNNLLPLNILNTNWNVKLGTLAGTGFPTLETLNVIKNTAWIDGKPVDKRFVNEGDGTVLRDSVFIPQADTNDVINQTHAGVVGSTEGINKILHFFGSPGVEDPPFTEPKSALVLIGFPGNFTLTDRKGNNYFSRDGLISIINPNSEEFKLYVNPVNSETTVIVAQFLQSGNTGYKEYVLKGPFAKPKIIEFDNQNINNDPLQDDNTQGNQNQG